MGVEITRIDCFSNQKVRWLVGKTMRELNSAIY
jgi:hypothetical protein